MCITHSATSAREPNNFLTVLKYLHFCKTGYIIPGNSTWGYFNDYIFAHLTRPVISGSNFSIIGVHILKVSQVQKCPEIAVSFQYDMSAPTAIATIGSAHGGMFIPHKMPASRTAMAAAAKNANLVYEITFLHRGKDSCWLLVSGHWLLIGN